MYHTRRETWDQSALLHCQRCPQSQFNWGLVIRPAWHFVSPLLVPRCLRCSLRTDAMLETRDPSPRRHHFHTYEVQLKGIVGAVVAYFTPVRVALDKSESFHQLSRRTATSMGRGAQDSRQPVAGSFCSPPLAVSC